LRGDMRSPVAACCLPSKIVIRPEVLILEHMFLF
jgi:hypothetical protein